MMLQIGRNTRLSVRGEVIGRRNDRRPDEAADRNHDHVRRNSFQYADTRIETLSIDVHQRTLGDDLYRHLRVTTQIFQHKRRQDHTRSAERCVDPQYSGRLGTMLIRKIKRIADGRQCRRDLGNELLPCR